MPALALYVVMVTRRPRGRLVGLTLVALGWSWLGDTIPRFLSGDPAFLALVGCFLIAQIVYVAAFWPYADASILYHRRILLVPYLIFVGILMVLTVPGAGALAVPVVIYGLCLLAMAVLATGVHPWTWAGAVLFLISDSLIALNAFVDGYPLSGASHDLAVMSTYAVAQFLIVAGVLRVATDCPVPAAGVDDAQPGQTQTERGAAAHPAG